MVYQSQVIMMNGDPFWKALEIYLPWNRVSALRRDCLEDND